MHFLHLRVIFLHLRVILRLHRPSIYPNTHIHIRMSFEFSFDQAKFRYHLLLLQFGSYT